MTKNYRNRICECKMLFICIMVIILVLLVLYFCQFHGELSTEISDWANWSTFIAGIGTMLFTGLNVWVLITINESIMRREEELSNFELQKMALNNFRRWMYRFFMPDDEQGTANFKRDWLGQSRDYIESLSVYKNILPTFGSATYEKFCNSFIDFGKKCHSNDPTLWQNSSEEKEAYVLFMQARDIMLELTKDMLNSNKNNPFLLCN